MSDLAQKGYEFSFLRKLFTLYFVKQTENSRRTDNGLPEQSFSLCPECHSSLVSSFVQSGMSGESMSNDFPHSEFLGYELFHRHWCEDEKTFQQKQYILCHNVLAGIFSCVIILFTSSKQSIIMTISFTYQSKSYHPLCWFFYVLPYHWLHILFGDLIFRHNMRKIFRNISISGLDDIDFCSSLSELGSHRPQCYLQSCTADLGPCYLTVALSPFIILIPIRGYVLCKIHPYERIQGYKEWCWQFFPSM